MTFSVPVDEEGRPSHGLGSVAQVFAGQVRQFPVQSITIDSEALNDVGFIKIDVEQHEREVLRCGLATIERCRLVILIEVCPLKYQRPIQADCNRHASITRLLDGAIQVDAPAWGSAGSGPCSVDARDESTLQPQCVVGGCVRPRDDLLDVNSSGWPCLGDLARALRFAARRPPGRQGPLAGHLQSVSS